MLSRGGCPWETYLSRLGAGDLGASRSGYHSSRARPSTKDACYGGRSAVGGEEPMEALRTGRQGHQLTHGQEWCRLVEEVCGHRGRAFATAIEATKLSDGDPV